ncbi:MAG: hypothetical protein SOV16_00460 [Anaerobiospirillum succiniciproducens]|uniref:hypothetical protein n=1 Tax=Anaerobiospirillum succiniciproducens TaxID=13335 RepID=UPI002A75279F|nr:hypothetical protein [Anaerobiospirillum succiniciproducens]MDY2797653.1 hypothetical protein [Anaerobiospirillum succiniciproducens]
MNSRACNQDNAGIFEKLLELQKSLNSPDNNELKQRFDFMEQILIAFAVMKVVLDKSKGCTVSKTGRAGHICLEGFDKKYFKSIELAIKSIERKVVNNKNNGIKKIDIIFNEDDESKNVTISVRNHGNEVGVLYVTSEALVNSAHAIDTGEQIERISTLQVIQNLPYSAFLSFEDSEINIEKIGIAIDESKFNALRIKDFFAPYRMIRQIIKNDKKFTNKLPKFIESAFNPTSDTGFAIGLCNNYLSQSANYLSAVLYLLCADELNKTDDVWTAFETAMGNALPVCNSPRNSAVFVSLNSKHDKKKWDICWKKAIIKDLHSGANLSKSIDKFENTAFDFLCESFKTNHDQFSPKEQEVIANFIEQYSSSDVSNDDNFILAWKKLYCIEWSDKLELLFSVDKQQSKKSKKSTVAADTIKLLNDNKSEILKEYNIGDEYLEDELEDHFNELLEVAKLGDSKNELDIDERNKIQLLLKALSSQLRMPDNKKLYDAWRKIVSQSSDEVHTDFRAGLCKAMLDAISYYKSAPSDADKNFIITSLDITVDYSFSELDYYSVQAISYFSMMYGSILNELIDESSNAKVTIKAKGAKEETLPSRLLWDLKLLGNETLKVYEFKDTIKEKDKGPSKKDYYYITFGLNFGFVTSDEADSNVYEFNKTFKWKYSSKSVASSLVNDVLALLGHSLNEVRDRTNYLSWLASSVTDVIENQSSSTPDVLKIAAYKYNLAGSKGLFKELSLNDNNCFQSTFNSLEQSPVFISPKALSISNVLEKAKEYILNSVKQQGSITRHEKNIKKFDEYLNCFKKSYFDCLKDFIASQLSFDSVQICCADFQKLLAHIEDNFPLYIGGRLMLLSLLNLGIAFDSSDREYVINTAIVCPWHLESLKATALKNERVIGLWKLLSDSNAGNVFDNTRLDVIDYELYEGGILGELSIDTYLEIIPNRDYLSPLSLFNLDEHSIKSISDISEINTALTQIESKDGYCLFGSINGNDHVSDSDIAMINNLILHSIENLGEVRNEYSVVLYQCMQKALPLRLQSNWISSGFLSKFESIKRVNLYVVYNNDDNGCKVAQEVRYKTEAALRRQLHDNPPSELGIFRKYNISVCTDDAISKAQNCAKFDLCILFDTFKSKSMTQLNRSCTEAEFLSTFDVVQDEHCLQRYAPSLSEYSNNQFTGGSRSLIRNMQSSSLASYLRAYAAISKKQNNGNEFLVPTCAFPDSKNVADVIKSTHRYASIVLSYDDFVRKNYFENIVSDSCDRGVKILQYRREKNSGKNIIFSASDSGIYSGLEALIASTLSEQLKNIKINLDYNELANLIYEDALKLSGSIVLRACNFHNNLFEMIGVVLSKFIVDKSIEFLGEKLAANGYTSKFTTHIMLDDFKGYLGLNKTSVADLLAINVLFNNESKQCLLNFVFAESKFYRSYNKEAKRNSVEQAFSSACSMSGHFKHEFINQENGILDLKAVRFDRAQFVSRIMSLILTDFENLRSESKDDQEINDIKHAIKTGSFSCLNTALSVFSSFDACDFYMSNKSDVYAYTRSNTVPEDVGINLGQINVGKEALPKLLDIYANNMKDSNTEKRKETNSELYDLISVIDERIKSEDSSAETFGQFLSKVLP